MHIPSGDTAALEIVPFDEALAQALQPSGGYDARRWLYVPNTYGEYRYLLVGSSSDKYLWIMSREKSLAKETLDQLLDKLRVRGYDTDKLLFVAQD